jgi:hypothetical protein
MQLIEPKVQPPLDPGFRPAVLANRNFRRQLQSDGTRAVIGLERSGGEVSRFEFLVYPEGHPEFDANYQYVERIVKFLLWQIGGHTIYFGGPRKLAGYLRQAYSENAGEGETPRSEFAGLPHWL